MPEARDRVVRGAGAAAGALGGGFFILRVASPVARVEPRRVGCRGVGEGKENIPPWAVTQRRRKSPLPEWYPRTPLRDITVVLNAVERRSRLRAARAEQRDHDPGATPQPTLPTNASPQEQSVSEQAPQEPGISEETPVNQFLPSDISDTPSAPIVTPPSPIEHPLRISPPFSFSLTPAEHHPPTVSVSTNLTPSDLKPTEYEMLSRSIEHSLQINSSLSSFSPTEHPPQTMSVSAIEAHHDSKPTEYEKQLLSSIDEIERVVMIQSLKRNPKVPDRRKAAQKRTLMSLR